MGFESQARNWFLLVLCYLHQRVLVFITDSVFGLAFSHLPKIYMGSVYSERNGNVSEVRLLMKPAWQVSIFMVTSIV